MTALKDLRESVATLLGTATGFAAHGHLPGGITPPVIAVVPGSPYIEAGPTFGSISVRLEAHLIVGATNNKSSTERLDAAIEDALVALINDGTGFESISEPYALESGGATHLAAVVTFRKPTPL